MVILNMRHKEISGKVGEAEKNRINPSDSESFRSD